MYVFNNEKKNRLKVVSSFLDMVVFNQNDGVKCLFYFLENIEKKIKSFMKQIRGGSPSCTVPYVQELNLSILSISW